MASKVTAKVITEKSNSNDFLNRLVIWARSLLESLWAGTGEKRCCVLEAGGGAQRPPLPGGSIRVWGVSLVHGCTSLSPFFLPSPLSPHGRPALPPRSLPLGSRSARWAFGAVGEKRYLLTGPAGLSLQAQGRGGVD